MVSTPDPARLAAFEELYRADVAVKRPRSLSEYIARFPEAPEAIRRRYIELTREAKRDSGIVVDAGADPDATREMRFEEIIDGYRIERQIGAGGQGTVFLATDLGLNRPVALKLLRSGPLDDPRVLSRFKLEAQVVATLDHPGICSVYGASTTDRWSWIAMRYVEGENLASLIDRCQSGSERMVRLPTSPKDDTDVKGHVDAILTLVEKTASALASAHRASIVHRDIKPQNIMVTPTGDPVLLDFGLAKVLWADDDVTRTGEALGTPDYMAPEQIRAGGQPIDERADVYSLGTVLYECLTLTRPHHRPTRVAVLEAIANDDAPDVRRHRPELSVDVATVVATAIERDLTRRYQSMSALARDLEALRNGTPVSVRPTGFVLSVFRKARRHPMATAAILLGALLLLSTTGFLGYVFATSGDRARGVASRERAEIDDRLSNAYTQLGEGKVAVARAESEAIPLSSWRSAELEAGRLMVRIYDEQRPLHPEDLLGLRAALPEGQFSRDIEQLAIDLASGPPNKDRPLRYPVATTDVEHFVLGEMLLLQGHLGDDTEAYERAYRCFSQACLLADFVPPVYASERAHAASHVSVDLETAREIRAVLLHRWPNLPNSWFWSGALLKQMDPATALSDLRRAIDMGVERGDAILDMAYCLKNLGRRAECLAMLDEGLETEPDSRATYLAEKARILADWGRAAEALPLLEEAERLSPRDIVILTTRVRVELSLERFDGVIAAADRVLAVQPRQARIWMQKAVALAHLDRPDEAKAAFERGRELDEAYAHEAPFIEQVYTRIGRRAEAASMVRNWVERHAGDHRAWFLLGRLEDAERRDAAAVRAFERAIAIEPRAGDYHGFLARTWARIGFLERALSEAELARRCAPEIVAAWTTYARIAIDCNRANDALVALEDAHARFPQNLDVLELMITARMAKGDAAGARTAAEQVLEGLPPEDTAAHERARQTIARLDAEVEFQDSLAAIARSAGELPEDPIALLRLASVAERRADWRLATRLFDEALADGMPQGVRVVSAALGRSRALARLTSTKDAGRGSETKPTRNRKPETIEWLATAVEDLEDIVSKDGADRSAAARWRMEALEIIDLLEPVEDAEQRARIAEVKTILPPLFPEPK